jgi:hypothetical protein
MAGAVQRRVTLGHVEYAPNLNNFDALVLAVETGGFVLGHSQRQRLHDVYTNGNHDFYEAEDLRSELFQTKTGMSAVHNGKSTDGADNRWFASPSVENAVPPDEGLEHEGSNKFRIQCAVAGGEIYRLVLGGYQPEMFSTEIGGVPHRLSDPVRGFQDFPLDPEEDHLSLEAIQQNNDLLQLAYHRQLARESGHDLSNVALGRRHPMIDGTNGVYKDGQVKPIEGVLSVFAAALFLGDMDLNGGNLGLVETSHHFQAVKVDPEASFSRFFFDDDPDKVTENLQQPGVSLGEGEFNETFAGTLESAFDSEELIAGFLHNPESMRQMFITIAIIIRKPAQEYHDIIHRCIGDEFRVSRQALCVALTQRLQVFRDGAMALPGFPLFLLQYQ